MILANKNVRSTAQLPSPYNCYDQQHKCIIQ